MKAKFIGIPVAIFAAVIIVYLVLRGKNAATVTNQPSPASSGVVPSSQTGIPLQQYQVNPPVLQPASIVSLAGPAAPYSNATGVPSAPAQSSDPTLYLTYNLGPTAALHKGKPTSPAPAPGAPVGCGGSCGCTLGCKNNAQQVMEGQGSTCMATSKKSQIDTLEKKYPGLWAAMAMNLYEAGADPNDVMLYWQQRDNPNQHTGDVTTAGNNSKHDAGALITGKVGHA